MRPTTILNRFVALSSLFAVIGCDDRSEIDDRGAVTAPPAQILDSRGQTMTLQGPGQYEIIELGSIPQVTQHEPSAPITSRSRDELANELRGVRLVDGYEYLVDAPDYAMADRILAGIEGPTETRPSHDEGMDDITSREPRGLNGADNRAYVGTNLSFPYRPLVFSEVGCSGTMIGPHTMVTAAHCVYDTDVNAWLRVWDSVQAKERWPRFATGVDGRDVVPVPNGWQQCYDVTIPIGWVNQVSNNAAAAAEYDYAVVDFFSRCGVRPGDASGWLGTNVAGEGTIEAEGQLAYGYPQTALGVVRYTSSPPTMEAEIWGMSMGPGQLWIDAPAYQLKYNHDTTGGQSGMGVWYIEDGSGWVFLDGIHRGDGGAFNIGRRWDWTVRNFVEAYSLFPAI